MIIFVTALHCEAKPLIDFYGMKRSFSSSGREFFESAGKLLAVSGIGKIKSAVATAAALENVKDRQAARAVNFGVCGAKPGVDEGELLLINKVTDAASRRSYYPDMLIKHGLREAQLETFDSPVRLEGAGKIAAQAVDMEASGFCEAAAVYLPASRFALIKLVSDNLEGTKLSAAKVTALVEQSLEPLTRFLAAFEGLADPSPPYDQTIVRSVSEKLRLTAYQRSSLAALARRHGARNGGSLETLAQFLTLEVKTKHEQKEAFEKIKLALSA